jgi:DNA-binding transcriptional MocR family regulator
MIELGLQKDYLNFLKKTYRDRMVALSGALRQKIPTLRFTDPDGGYFIWSYLAEETDAEILLAEANKHQVGFQPGIKFSSAQGLRNYLRFCFAFYGEANLVEGVERLARIIR